MSRILIAWELGANYGHLASCLRVAQALRERHHAVVFAVRDTRAAAEFLSPAGFSFVQAPLFGQKTRLSRPPANYSEILLGEGYADPLGLLGTVRAWRSLLQLSGPDLVLAEYAPTAMIAAHSMGTPCLALANGFGVPPRTSLLPSIRPWEAIPDTRLAQADRTVDASIAAVLQAVGGPPCPKLADLYHDALLCTFAELDPFGPRPGGHYIGPIFALPGTRTATWSADSGRRILAYLRPDMDGLPPLMEALSAIDGESICVIPGLSREKMNRWRSDRLQIHPAPLVLDGLLRQADAFVSYGGSGVVCQALLAGVPLLIAPRFVEQYLNAKCAESVGAAVVIEANRSRQDFARALNQVLEERTFRASARDFAEKHAAFTTEHAVERAANAIELSIGQCNTPTQALNN